MARTHLLLRHSALPEGTAAVMRTLTKVGRGIIVSGYMRAYSRATRVPLPTIAPWTPVHAAARLAEGIEVERSTMSKGVFGAAARESRGKVDEDR